MMLKRLIDKLKNRWEIKIVLTNTLLHLFVGAAFGLSAFISKFIPDFIVFIPLGFLIATIGFEAAQRQRAREWNWIDSVTDVLAGNIGFNIIYWLIILILRRM